MSPRWLAVLRACRRSSVRNRFVIRVTLEKWHFKKTTVTVWSQWLLEAARWAPIKRGGGGVIESRNRTKSRRIGPFCSLYADERNNKRRLVRVRELFTRWRWNIDYSRTRSRVLRTRGSGHEITKFRCYPLVRITLRNTSSRKTYRRTHRTAETYGVRTVLVIRSHAVSRWRRKHENRLYLSIRKLYLFGFKMVVTFFLFCTHFLVHLSSFRLLEVSFRWYFEDLFFSLRDSFFRREEKLSKTE